VLNELSDADRDALMLRFFERKSAREIAAILKINDDAAQKRVSRALDRLRELFGRRGVVVGAGALAASISVNAVQAAPIALAAKVATGAFQTGTLTATTLKVIAMTTLQKTLVGTALIAAIGTGILEAHRASRLQGEIQTLQQQQAPLAAQIQQLQKERDDATNRLAALQTQPQPAPNAELLKLRGESTSLRQDSAALAQMKSDQKEKTAAQSDFMNFVVAQMGSSMTNAALRKATDLKDKLGLSAEQEQQLRTLLMNSAQTQVQASLSAVTGKLTDESRNPMHLAREDENSKILALLTPEQQVAYQNLQQEEAANAIQYFAKRESSAMQTELNLSDDQAHAVSSVLAGLPPTQGGLGNATAPNAKEQLDLRLQALAPLLTPEQLEAYKQSKLAEIQQAASSLQMFKSFSK
jgi:hypothetical protein